MAEALRVKIGSADLFDNLEISASWPTVIGSSVALIVESADGTDCDLWVDFDPSGACTVSGSDGQPGGEPVAQLIAGPGTWRALLDRKSNLVTEITAGRLRCINKRDSHRIRSDEVHAIAAVLGLAQVPVLSRPGETGSVAAQR